MGRRNRNVEEVKYRIDDVKKELCHIIQWGLMRRGWSNREAAYWLGTSQSVVSSIQNSKVERLKINQLFVFLARVRPQFRILISPD